MKIKLLFIASFFFVFLVQAVFAQKTPEKVDLNDKDEKAVESFVSTLTDTPIAVILKAELVPPQTKYHTEFVEEDVTIVSDQIANLIAIPKDLTGWTKKFSVHFTADIGNRKWEKSIPCGSWKVDSAPFVSGAPIGSQELGIWSHPNEGKVKCPHAQGTDHPGTIIVSGAYRIVLDYHENSVVSPKPILNGTWSYNCRYTEGSKSGSLPCDVKLTSWEGQYGKMPISTTDKTTDKSKSTTQKVILALASLGIFTAAVFLFKRFH